MASRLNEKVPAVRPASNFLLTYRSPHVLMGGEGVLVTLINTTLESCLMLHFSNVWHDFLNAAVDICPVENMSS